MTSTRQFVMCMSSGWIGYSYGVAIDSSGALCVTYNHRVRFFSADGQFI